MKLRYLAIFFIVIALSSCKWGVPTKQTANVFTDTLNFSYKTVKQKAADCNAKTDNGCNIVKFTYPVFKGQQNLNDSVFYRLGAMFQFMAKGDTDFKRGARTFFMLNPAPSSNDLQKPPFYPLNEYAKVVRQDSSLTTIETGGYLIKLNNPKSNVSFINWDTRANKKIELNDLFNPGYEDSLKKIAEHIFRKDEKLSDTASLVKDYLFKDGKFALNGNYLITPYGLRFLYNEGEIKPRNAGFTILFIGYPKIRTLLKSHTVLARYL